MSDNGGGFVPIDLGDFDTAEESTRPPKLPPGKYDFELTDVSFREAASGNVGIRFECSVVNADDPSWNGRKLNYDGWWNTGFLTQALLAFGGREMWPEIRDEMSDPEGLMRIRDGRSEVLLSLKGKVAEGIVQNEKDRNDPDVLWPRIRRFTVRTED